MTPTQPTHTTPEVSEAMVERACEIARDHLEIDGDNEGAFIRFDSIENAVRAILSAALSPGDGVQGMVLVPKNALDWLFGEGPDDDGIWFGDAERVAGAGAFWWRTVFRRMLGRRSPSQNGRTGE